MTARIRWRPGLVSVTLRELSLAEVLEAARRAQLTAIEWGGDVHVPPGDVRQARDARTMTIDSGLDVAAYGSYYRVGASPQASFGPVLETAVELGAPTVRVWAGTIGSGDADETDRRRVVEDSRRIADLAATAGVVIAYEHHAGTLTDTAEATLSLIDRVGRSNVRTLWQPPTDAPIPDCIAGLERLLPHLVHVHVFHWHPGTSRRPLSEGSDRWPRFLRLAGTDTGRFALLEFVINDDPRQLVKDAQTLRRWLDDLSNGDR